MLEEQLYANNEILRACYIVGAIVFNLAYYAYIIKSKPTYLVTIKINYGHIEKNIGRFAGISFFFFLWFSQIGFDTEKLMLRMFGQTSDVIWLAFALGIIYSLFFARAVFHIIEYYPDALKLIRIALVAYIPARYCIPLITCQIYSLLSCKTFLFSEYFKADMTAHYWFDGLYCGGYLLYFTFSKNIKDVWRDLAYFKSTDNKLDQHQK